MNKITAVLLLSSMALSGLAYASSDKQEYEGKFCHHGKHEGTRGDARLQRMTKLLSLSEQQVTQIRAIKDERKPTKMALRENIKAKRKQLREAFHSEEMDKEKIKQLAKEMGLLVTKKIILRSEIRNEVNKFLTSKQREKMKGMHRKRHGCKH